MGAEDCLVQVFAKAAVCGQVKTRLIPLLGGEAATQLHVRLVEHTLATVTTARVGGVEVWTTSIGAHAADHVNVGSQTCPVRLQPEGDLGTRMDAAARDGLSRADAIMVVGTDCPVMTASDLRAACAALARGSDAVLGPAEDGGYWLIALRRYDSALFDGIPWSTDRVLEVQRDRLRALGWHWEELRTLWDVDRTDDFDRLRRDPALFPLTAGLLGVVAAG